MRIGIDIDDTICSTNELIIVEADKYDKEVLGGTGIKDSSAYEFTEMMGWDTDGKGKFFKDRLEYIMSRSPIKDGVVEVINTLYDEGNEIYFITYRKDKYIKDPFLLSKNWLDMHGIKYNKLIANSGEKGIVCHENKIDLFIDDSVAHCEDVDLYGIRVFLFTNAYNKDNIKFERVDNWYQIYNKIKKIKEK
jgi:uncharacterized HAD superfamily protein